MNKYHTTMDLAETQVFARGGGTCSDYENEDMHNWRIKIFKDLNFFL